MKPQNVGKFNHKVTFRRITEVTDDFGTHQDVEDLRTVWAFVSEVHGREFYEAQKIRTEKTFKIICRYFPGIIEDDFVYFPWRDKQLKIIDVNNADEEGAWYVIQAIEVDV